MSADHNAAMPRHVLLLGASSPVGRVLGPLLTEQGWTCAFRARRPWPAPGWCALDLGTDTTAPDTPSVVSLGPLDLFTTWLQRVGPGQARRILALSSISARTKQTSAVAAERALATQLLQAEQALQQFCAEHRLALTIVRLSLVWDGEHDASIAPMRRFAQRWHVLPYPLRRGGLRNPIHAADVAQELARLLTEAGHDSLIEVGGPETLTTAEIWQRVAIDAKAWRLPMPMLVLRGLCAVLPPLAKRLQGTLSRWDDDQLAPALIRPDARRFLDPLARRKEPSASP